MRSSLRGKLTYANLVATIAVFVALSGTSYAALVVTGKTVKNGSLTGADVKNRSLGAGELSRRARSSLRGSAGSAGPAGPQGATGSVGPAGPAGVAKAYARVAADGSVTNASGGITVTTAGSSSFCISGLSFAPQSIVTSAATPFEPGTDIFADLGTGGASLSGCPASTQAFVITYDASSADRRPFFVLVN